VEKSADGSFIPPNVDLKALLHSSHIDLTSKSLKKQQDQVFSATIDPQHSSTFAQTESMLL
jgi:hypothetical protein